MSTCQRLSSDAGRLTGLMHDCNRRSMILDLWGIGDAAVGGPPRLIRWRGDRTDEMHKALFSPSVIWTSF